MDYNSTMDREIAEALVQGWKTNDWIWHTIKLGLLAQGTFEKHVPIERICSLLGIQRIRGKQCREVLANHFRIASDMLWDNHDDNIVIKCLMTIKASDHRTSGKIISHNNQHRTAQAHYGGARLHIQIRERDKRTDWHTVK